jgi:hypothetical protein
MTVTGNEGSMSRRWGTNAIRRLARWIEPELGRTRPIAARKRVVFPAPLGPSSATVALGGISKLTSSSAGSRP